ncbi:MAG: hypothetical protein F9K29_06850 [Hyphomicrobiaceae bacterium]|nr:MAG: hypothetical protein F9K29_06850 [Hyphomicrobiaceae bacterium]
MRRRLLVVTNPGAGLGGSSLVDATIRVLEREGAVVTRCQPADAMAARDAVRKAAEERAHDAVVAAGGDGTIRHAAAALLGKATPLGIIPVGTGNVLAHEIGLAPRPEVVAHVLLTGPTARIACAQANGEPFLLMAGAGFDARVVAALDQRFKSRLGKIAYAGPLLGALAQPMDRLTVTIDARAHQASWAVVANARCYGGGFIMAPRTSVRQRGLQAILFRARSRTMLLSQLMSLVRGDLDARATAGGDIAMLPCSHVSITAPRPVPVQIDGDVFGTTPLVVEEGTGELDLIVPGAPGNGGSAH